MLSKSKIKRIVYQVVSRTVNSIFSQYMANGVNDVQVIICHFLTLAFGGSREDIARTRYTMSSRLQVLGL